MRQKIGNSNLGCIPFNQHYNITDHFYLFPEEWVIFLTSQSLISWSVIWQLWEKWLDHEARWTNFYDNLCTGSCEKNSCMFEFGRPLSAQWPRQPMHSPSDLREHVSPNLAGFFLLDPVVQATCSTFPCRIGQVYIQGTTERLRQG